MCGTWDLLSSSAPRAPVRHTAGKGGRPKRSESRLPAHRTRTELGADVIAASELAPPSVAEPTKFWLLDAL